MLTSCVNIGSDYQPTTASIFKQLPLSVLDTLLETLLRLSQIGYISI